MKLAIGARARDAHPVDVIEKIASKHDWVFERTAIDEISVCVEWKIVNLYILLVHLI